MRNKTQSKKGLSSFLNSSITSPKKIKGGLDADGIVVEDTSIG